MAIDPSVISRLKSQLLISGLQQKDSALFQVINQLIGLIDGISSLSDSSSGGGSSGVVINNTTTFISSDGIDLDSNEELTIPGPMGLSGKDGLVGIPGIDGIDGEDSFIQLISSSVISGLIGLYAPGSFTLITGQYEVMSNHLILTSVQRFTGSGNSRLRITT